MRVTWKRIGESLQAVPGRIRGRTAAAGAPEELRAFFLHISKTAGQSVRQALAPHPFVLSNVKQVWLGWKDDNDYSYERFAREGFAAVMRDGGNALSR